MYMQYYVKKLLSFAYTSVPEISRFHVCTLDVAYPDLHTSHATGGLGLYAGSQK